MKNMIVIKYSEQRIQRQGQGFDTDCYSYDSDTNFGYYRMRSDCVNDCYQDKMRELCQVDQGLFMSYTLIRKDYIDNKIARLISCYESEYNRQSFIFKQECENMCKVECVEKYYRIEIEKNEIYKQYVLEFLRSFAACTNSNKKFVTMNQ